MSRKSTESPCLSALEAGIGTEAETDRPSAEVINGTEPACESLEKPLASDGGPQELSVEFPRKPPPLNLVLGLLEDELAPRP
jgi:hypothetical protein